MAEPIYSYDFEVIAIHIAQYLRLLSANLHNLYLAVGLDLSGGPKNVVDFFHQTFTHFSFAFVFIIPKGGVHKPCGPQKRMRNLFYPVYGRT